MSLYSHPDYAEPESFEELIDEAKGLYDRQYQDTIIYRDSKEAIIELADKIIRTFGHTGLMSQLNDMQLNTHYYNADGDMVEDELFSNKFEIPA